VYLIILLQNFTLGYKGVTLNKTPHNWTGRIFMLH